MKCTRRIVGLAILAALNSVAVQAQGHWTANGVPPPAQFFGSCEWGEPRHGGAREYCKAQKLVLAQIEKHLDGSFGEQGWKVAKRTATKYEDHTEVQKYYIRLDCGSDYATQTPKENIVGRLSIVSICEYPRHSMTVVSWNYQELDAAGERMATCSLMTIAGSQTLTAAEKRERFRVAQRNMGATVFAAVVRKIPVLDPASESLVTLDQFLQSMYLEMDPSATSAISRDPVGAALSILLNPSLKNIADQSGLPWPP